jgi:hypothetical protein
MFALNCVLRRARPRSARLVHIWCCGAGARPLPPENLNDFAVELMGIEPTASRVRFFA